MNIIKTFALAVLLAHSFVANSMANPVITVEVQNNTFGTMRMKKISGPDSPPSRPLTAYNIGPGSSGTLKFPYTRNFTYTTSGWQPTKNKVAPIHLNMEYEVHGYKCLLETRLEAPVRFGYLEPAYKPDWKSSVKSSGNNKYTCKAEISKKKSEPPFSYTINLSIDK